MEDPAEQAVLRVIETMRERLGERLTIDDMARTAMFSKFHFTRIFQRVTGLSPGRFLSAMRLQKAQELLVTTSLNVADISYQVGYNSVGTFSSRFARSVGLSPTEYRQHGGYTPEVRMDRMAHTGHQSVAVRGTVLCPLASHPARVFVGLFPDLTQGRPVACTVLNRPGSYLLECVPPGTWYLVATSISNDHGTTDHPTMSRHRTPTDPTLYLSRHPGVTVPPDTVVRLPDIRLRPSRAIDPPMLLALPGLQRDGVTPPPAQATGVHLRSARSWEAHHESAATASAPAQPGSREP
ncbi:MAG TPA: helix-turn-helix transcriptional regulator [Micromonosporaceae bacterium]